MQYQPFLELQSPSPVHSTHLPDEQIGVDPEHAVPYAHEPDEHPVPGFLPEQSVVQSTLDEYRQKQPVVSQYAPEFNVFPVQESEQSELYSQADPQPLLQTLVSQLQS
jgi:hypothetical protein